MGSEILNGISADDFVNGKLFSFKFKKVLEKLIVALGSVIFQLSSRKETSTWSSDFLNINAAVVISFSKNWFHVACVAHSLWA
jgi:hypothetical protein